ncbi:MAG: ATP-grasp domain-containing protein [Patescibacteria group bacterium]
MKDIKKLRKNPDRDTILFVGSIPSGVISAIKADKRKFKIALIYDSKNRKLRDKEIQDGVDFKISCDLSSPSKIIQALMPYHQSFLAVTCRVEKNIPDFKKIIPHLPYLRTPTTESLSWSTDKVAMRKRLSAYDKKITPIFKVIHNANKDTLRDIEEKVGFPLVVKPAGLAQSLLVSICYHKEELKKVLKNIFRKVKKVLKESDREGMVSDLLVEQFMDGDMYSVDGYVTSRGKVYFCPFVHIKTGRLIGFDDFFGYQQMTPTLLKKSSVDGGEAVSVKAVYALGLRSTTVHIELMKTENGWKIIEVGPRVGGFRQKMYELSYGINHAMNDILIRIQEKPIISKKVKGYTASLKFFAKNEGNLIKLIGIKKAKELSSFKSIDLHKKIGDRCIFAKNGGKSVFDITLFNIKRPGLLADIRRVEQMIKIEAK